MPLNFSSKDKPKKSTNDSKKPGKKDGEKKDKRAPLNDITSKSPKASKTTATEKKSTTRHNPSKSAAPTSTSASTTGRHSHKAKGHSNVMKFDVEYNGFFSKDYLKKHALHIKKAKAARKKKAKDSKQVGPNPLKSSWMAGGSGSASKSNEHSAASMFSRLIPATLQGDGLHVTTLIELGTAKTTITTHRVGVDSGDWGFWVGPKYLSERSQGLLKNRKVDAKFLDPISYDVVGLTLQRELYHDTLTIAGMVVENQEFGVVKDVPKTVAKGTNEYSMPFSDGILGIMINSDDFSEVEEKQESGKFLKRPFVSVLENLFLQKQIQDITLFLHMEPWNTKETDPIKKKAYHGELYFGKLSEEQKKGFKFASIGATYMDYNASGSSMKLTIADGTDKLLTKKYGMIDSGSPLIYLKENAINKYLSKLNMNRDSFEKKSGTVLEFFIPEKDFSKLNPLVLSYTDIDSKSVSFSLSPFAQVLPPTLNDAFGVPKGYLGLLVGDLGPDDEDDDCQFIIGTPFLTRFDVVFDAKDWEYTGNLLVGIRENKFADVEWKGLKWH